MRDIFATSMGGTFTETTADGVVEQGSWSYEGYGNAEVKMVAEGVVPGTGVHYRVTIHSAEYAIDSITCRSTWNDGDQEVVQEFEAEIIGLEVKIRTTRGDETLTGDITVPDLTIYEGPSPIWLIHTLITDLPADGREATLPLASFDPRTGGLVGGFYRFFRSDLKVTARRLDEEGRQIDQIEILLADDGCPKSFRSDGMTTEIVRIPRGASVEARQEA